VDVHGKHNGQILDVAGVCVNRIGTEQTYGDHRFLDNYDQFEDDRRARYRMIEDAEKNEKIRSIKIEKIDFSEEIQKEIMSW